MTPTTSCDREESKDQNYVDQNGAGGYLDKMKSRWSGMRSRSARRATDHEIIKTGLVVITKLKGGRRALEMDMEEVKACRDLGFELEQHKLMITTFANSTEASTSSCPNSPLIHWHISSPGDDPRDVKVWAQAVALVSSSLSSGAR